MGEKRALRRNPRIEALRLIAIAGIAVFHTFQPWFDAATSGAWPASPHARRPWPHQPARCLRQSRVLPHLRLLSHAPRGPGGSGGNRNQSGSLQSNLLLAQPGEKHPAAGTPHPCDRPLLRSGRACREHVGHAHPERPLTQTGWLIGGLQFIWVYLAVVVATPVMGWVWARVRRPYAVVAALVAIVFVVNAYIAFVSPGDETRGLLEWRKLMSAVSYLVAFLAGGALAERPLSHPGRLLGGCVAAALVTEGAAGITANLGLLGALSFKSTSLVSFALAVASLGVAAQAREESPGGLPVSHARLTGSILGFYVAQSMFSQLWHPAANEPLRGGGGLRGRRPSCRGDCGEPRVSRLRARGRPGREGSAAAAHQIGQRAETKGLPIVFIFVP